MLETVDLCFYPPTRPFEAGKNTGQTLTHCTEGRGGGSPAQHTNARAPPVRNGTGTRAKWERSGSRAMRLALLQIKRSCIVEEEDREAERKEGRRRLGTLLDFRAAGER